MTLLPALAVLLAACAQRTQGYYWLHHQPVKNISCRLRNGVMGYQIPEQVGQGQEIQGLETLCFDFLKPYMYDGIPNIQEKASDIVVKEKHYYVYQLSTKDFNQTEFYLVDHDGTKVYYKTKDFPFVYLKLARGLPTDTGDDWTSGDRHIFGNTLGFDKKEAMMGGNRDFGLLYKLQHDQYQLENKNAERQKTDLTFYAYSAYNHSSGPQPLREEIFGVFAGVCGLYTMVTLMILFIKSAKSSKKNNPVKTVVEDPQNPFSILGDSSNSFYLT